MVGVRATNANVSDRAFLMYIIILLVGGLVALISASAPVGYAKFHDTYFFVKRQMLFGIVPGTIIFLVLAKLPCQWWQRHAWGVYALTLFGLLLVFIPGVGTVINGSRSWLNIVGFNIQPSEFAKLGLIIMTAVLLSSPKYNWNNWQQSILPILSILAPTFMLVAAQPDVGTLSIMVTIVFIMLYVARVPARYLLILGSLGIAVFMTLVIMAPYRAQRLTTFLHPELDPKGVGYHINQAFLAIGSGGLWGLGYGHSRQKFQYLPEVSADSIYAVIAEENGFIVAAGLVILILLLGWRGLKIAKYAPDTFARLLTTGIIVWIVWQSFLNIGAMVGVLPLTGVPLPFVSHGGSAMIALLAAAAIVVNVSKNNSI